MENEVLFVYIQGGGGNGTPTLFLGGWGLGGYIAIQLSVKLYISCQL